MIVAEIAAPGAGAVAAAKAYLRIEDEAQDALIGSLAASATGLCEGFTRQVVISRDVVEHLLAGCQWMRLGRSPVRSIESVTSLSAAGASEAIAVDGYAIDIDAHGDGWVRLTRPIDAKRIAVAYSAGMAAEWDALPPAVGQGIVRLIAHLFTHRDADGERGPPSAIAALWRPWRRMALR